MRLTEEDKTLLTSWGYQKEDFEQIEEAMTMTVYEMNDKKISLSKAIKVLGRETYLTGIGRSVFHWSAYRENKKGQGIHFDSSRLFR